MSASLKLALVLAALAVSCARCDSRGRQTFFATPKMEDLLRRDDGQTSSSSLSSLDPMPYHLQLSDKAKLSWNYNLRTNLIAFNLEVPRGTNVLGLGFSDRGEIPGAEFGIVYVDGSEPVVITDFKVTSDKRLKRQATSVYKLANSAVTDQSVIVSIYRPINTEESDYYSIDRGTSHLLFFKSFFVWDSLSDYDVSVHLVQLLKSQLPVPPPEPDAVAMEIRVQDVQVPAAETTYWCRVVEMPLMAEPGHIIGYEPVISSDSKGLVHHLEVFLCLEDLPESVRSYNGPCNSETKPLGMTSCRKVIGAWAMGATGIIYPKDAGFPIGGTNRKQHAVIELHYNNEALKSDLKDSSGLRFYVTKQLRPYDVGILELGLDYLPNSAVPPGQARFDLPGYCMPECTEATLPPDGIKIFASQLHTHSTGVRVRTLQVRQRRGRRPCTAKMLNDDRHYSPHFQEIRLLPKPVTVLPGDALITTCTYDTALRKNVTIGGLSISNEMCVNYVFYYPKTEKLELCKSVIGRRALNGFFGKMKLLYGADTSPEKGLEENYRSIGWGRMEVASLRHLYRTGGIHQSCNTSAGVEFPGHNWEDMKPTSIYCPGYD